MAGLTPTELNADVDAATARLVATSLHSGDPSTTGANELTGGTYARVTNSWGASSSGTAVTTQATINVPSAAHPTYFGEWSATTAGTFRGGNLLGTDPGTYSSAGTLLTTVTLAGSTS
jgi:hypothetical protein